MTYSKRNEITLISLAKTKTTYVRWNSIMKKPGRD